MGKVLRKQITIASACSLSLYGGTFGPIRSPFYETIPNIARLICDGIEVYEETKNGKVRLTLSNFDKFEEDTQRIKADEAKSKQVAEQAAKEARIKAEQEAKAKAEKENRERVERHNQQQKQKNNQQHQQQKPVVDNIVEE